MLDTIATTPTGYLSALLPLFQTLAGALIALATVWVQNRLTSRRERDARKAEERMQRLKDIEQRYRENIETSVVAFVDEMLRWISSAYWDKVRGGATATGFMLKGLQEKEASFQARLKAMRRADLEKHYSDLDKTYCDFIQALPDAPGGRARDLMREAWGQAGNFFEALYGAAPEASL